MDTITTIQSLLTLNGSAQPVMVALTQSEFRLIAAAPTMLEALKAVFPYVTAGEALLVRNAIRAATGTHNEGETE